MLTEQITPNWVVEVERRAQTLAALGDPFRLRILDTLVLGDMSPGELGIQLGLSSNLLAHHLGVLERAGLVARHRSQADRRRSYLRLVSGALEGLLPGLDAHTDREQEPPQVGRVVFVCTANSARSQIAAALWQQNSTVPSTSAGTHPAVSVAPGAIAVAARHALPLSQATPQLLSELADDDYLVTVCDNAHEDLVSATPSSPTRRLHWSVPDPVPAGSDEAFDAAFIDILGRVLNLARHLTPTSLSA